MFIYCTMHNHTLNYFSFDDNYYRCSYMLHCIMYYFDLLIVSVEIVNLKKLQKSINENKILVVTGTHDVFVSTVPKTTTC